MSDEQGHTDWLPYIIALCFMGCALPPIRSFWDPYILPKWYVGAVFAIVAIVYTTQKRRTVSAKEYDWIDTFTMPAVSVITFETIYCLVDLCHWGWHVPSAGIQGTFDAPAGLALSCCLLTPVVVCALVRMPQTAKGVSAFRILCVAVIIMSTCLVLLSKSRTGMLAICIECMVMFACSRQHRRMGLAAASLLFALTISLCILTKSDSTMGRRFIAQLTCDVIRESPVMGHGIGGFEKTYMWQQADYFASYHDSPCRLLADHVKHPLNEFLLVWVDFGILGLVGIVVAFVCLFSRLRKNTICLTILAAILVFSLFSYPANYPLTWIAVGVCIVAALEGQSRRLCAVCAFGLVLLLGVLVMLPCDVMISRGSFYAQHHAHSLSMKAYKQCDVLFSIFPFSMVYNLRRNEYLYNCAYEFYVAGHLDEAARYTQRCSERYGSYYLELLTGDIYQALQIPIEAHAHYDAAKMMCPIRFAPLYGHLQTYMQVADTLKADSIASLILSSPIKVPSLEVNMIRHAADGWLSDRQPVRSNRLDGN